MRDRNGRHTPWALLAVVLTSAAPPAHGHNVSVSRGTFVVQERGARAELIVPMDDLLHVCRPTADAEERYAMAALEDCVARHGSRVLANFIVRDEAGERVAGRVVSTTHDLPPGDTHPVDVARRARVTFTLDFDLPALPRLLTLQQTFFHDGPSHAAQLALEVRVGEAPQGLLVPLTNYGNVATIAFAEGDSLPSLAAARPTAPDRFKALLSDLHILDEGVVLEVAMPLALLETWAAVPRTDRDFVSPEEQTAAAMVLETLLTKGYELQVDGRPLTLDIESARVLGPVESLEASPPAARRWSAHTARVAVRLRSKLTTPPRHVVLRWGLLNNAVLEAEVALHAGGTRRVHHLTAYAPELRWLRPAGD